MIAYQKFAFNLTLIDQIVYEIITNQFTPMQVVAFLTPFCNNVEKNNIAKKYQLVSQGDIPDHKLWIGPPGIYIMHYTCKSNFLFTLFIVPLSTLFLF